MESTDVDNNDIAPYNGLRTSSVSDQFKAASIKRQREMLPIFRYRRSLLYLIEKNQVVVLVGHTGSGKSTQLTQYLYEEGWSKDGKQIACTQPRRLAATSVASRVAEELGCDLGGVVGYSIRFSDMTSETTKIKYLTDGMLVRELLIDPLLTQYSVIMVDEAHERSVYTDILLSILKKVLKKRADLRVIVSSATLQAEEFVDFFGRDSTEIISIEGRMFPVDVLYLSKPTENYITKTIETILNIHEHEPDGDILVFLTGREEIDRVYQEISYQMQNLQSSSRKLLSLPLYSGLPQDEQMAVFEPAPDDSRKVIISTNIAEASVTIDGIVYVIDCGFVKIRAYNPLIRIESLLITPISKASAIQRAGRAGRTKPGKCFRLYTQSTFDNEMPDASIPEVQRSNLTLTILQLKSLGIDNIARMDFVASPPVELVTDALELLYSLGAIDEYAKLTKPVGIRMAELPLDPQISKILLKSQEYGCMSEILTIVATMSVKNILYVPQNETKAAAIEHRKFTVDEGDHLTMYNIYMAFTTRGKKSSKWAHERYLNYKALVQAVSVRNQLVKYLEKLGISSIDVDKSARDSQLTCKCLTSGLFVHAAKMQADGSFKLVNGGQIVWPHPSSVMFNRSADWIVFQEIMEMKDKIYILGITKIERDWLLEVAPDFYQIRRS
ncbi:P-loop containing nucleoside triphosphate hydrolase protein [Dipodascopsis uninucleata]